MSPKSGDSTYKDFLKTQHPSLSQDYSPAMQGHGSDSIINSEMVADNTFENEDGERVVDLGDGFLNMDKGYGRRNISWDEYEELSRFLDVPDNRGRPKFVWEQGDLYIKKGGTRKQIDDPDIDFRYAFPEMRDIAGGTTLPPGEQGEEEISLKKKLLTAGVGGMLVLGGIGGFMAWDADGDGLSNASEIFGNTDWNDPDTSGDGLQDGTAHNLGLNAAEQHPSVSAAYQGGLRGDNALAFQDINVTHQSLEEVADHIAELDDPGYVENVVDYLAEQPDHIPAMINGDGEVSQLGFEFMEDLPPQSIERLSDVPLYGTSEEFVQTIKNMNATTQIDYIESVVQDGNLSELGVHATPELPPEVVDDISPYDLDQTAKELVEHIKNEDLNNQTEYVSAVVEGDDFSELGVYAIPHLPVETVDDISQFSFNNVSQSFVQSLAEADMDNHTRYIDSVVVDGNISALGAYATPELPPEVVEDISPYELDQVAKDLVEHIDDEGLDSQTEYANAVIQEDDISDLGVYAIPHLGPDTVSELSPFDLDETGEELVDKLTQTEEDNRTEYVNAAEHDGRLSELGVYSVSYLTPEAVEEVSPFAFDDTGRELVQEIKNMDLENQTTYVNAVAPNGELSELGVDYIGDVKPEALDHISELSNNRRNRNFAENVSALPGDVQLDLAKEYAGDGQINEKELEQSYFLNLLQDKGELDNYLSHYDPTNTDVSGDGFTNLFSLTHSDHIKWDEENEVYAFHINSLEGDGDARSRYFDPLVEEAEIPEERTWELLNESATWDAFQKVTDRIAENMTNDDLLLLSMRGHGTSDGYFGFWDLGVPLEWVSDEIDDMNNTGLKNVMIDSCFGGSGKEHFQDLNNTITMFSSGENETADAALFPGALWRYMRTTDQEIYLSDSRIGGGYWFTNSPDMDDDDEVSLWEAWKTYMGLHVPDYPLTPEEYQKELYNEVDDPEALQTPQLVVGNSAELEDFYLADDLAVNRSDERYDVSHPF